MKSKKEKFLSGSFWILVGIIFLCAWLISGCGCLPEREGAAPPPPKPEENKPPGMPYNVTGKVIDQDKKPLLEATVTVLKDGTLVDSDSTDAEGKYYLWLEPGTYTFKAEKSGYQSAEKSETVPSTGETISVPDLVLTPAP